MQALHFFFGVGALTAPLLAKPFISPAPHSITSTPLPELSTLSAISVQSVNSSLEDTSLLGDIASGNFATTSPVNTTTTVLPHVFTGTFKYAFFISAAPLLLAGVIFAYFAYQRFVYRSTLRSQGLDSVEPGSPTAGGDSDNASTPVGRWSACRKAEFLGLLALFFVLYVGQEVAYGGFIFSYGVKGRLKMSSSSAALLTAVYWGAFSFGRALAIPLAWLRVPPGVMLAGDLVGSLFAAIFLLGFPGSSTILWVCSALMGVSLASVFPTAITWGEQYMTFTGRSATVFVIGASLGEMVIPLLVGHFGPLSLMTVSVVIIMSACAVFAVMFVRVRWRERFVVKHAVRLDLEMAPVETHSKSGTNGKAKFLIDSDSEGL